MTFLMTELAKSSTASSAFFHERHVSDDMVLLTVTLKLAYINLSFSVVSVISQAMQTPFRSYLQEMLALVRTKTGLIQLCFACKPHNVALIYTYIHVHIFCY